MGRGAMRYLHAALPACPKGETAVGSILVGARVILKGELVPRTRVDE
jgi:hypothetical protein